MTALPSFLVLFLATSQVLASLHAPLRRLPVRLTLRDVRIRRAPNEGPHF